MTALPQKSQATKATNGQIMSRAPLGSLFSLWLHEFILTPLKSICYPPQKPSIDGFTYAMHIELAPTEREGIWKPSWNITCTGC
jgi:hypothetical protein